MSFAFVFPGQGSQSLKMLDGIKHLKIVNETFNTAHEILGINFLAMLDEDSPENINKTINTQPLMLVSGYATYLAWYTQTNKAPQILAGHSLGEWTALLVGGVLSFEDALKLVKLRAEAMQNAVSQGSGAMAAVLGLEDDKIISICNQVEKETNGVVAGVNFNSPGQVVIAGDKNTVDIAAIVLKENGAKRVQVLPVSVPAHSRLMKPAADKLEIELQQIKFNSPKIPVIQNIAAVSYEDVDTIKSSLLQQIYSPVLWSKTINNIVNAGVKNIIECGPGKVLSGLNKRIDDTIISHNIHNEMDIYSSSLKLGLCHN